MLKTTGNVEHDVVDSDIIQRWRWTQEYESWFLESSCISTQILFGSVLHWASYQGVPTTICFSYTLHIIQTLRIKKPLFGGGEILLFFVLGYQKLSVRYKIIKSVNW